MRRKKAAGAPAARQSVHVRLLEELRHAILMGELRPGDPVPELHLARAHDVSQTTVREALVKLEHAGLVRRIHNVGTFVTQMSPREIQERLRLRVMLEGLAAMEAARIAQPRHLDEIGERLAALSAAIAANDYYETARADLEFHRTVWRGSGDDTLYLVLDRLTVPLFAFISIERRRLNESLTDAVQAHEPIAQALRERNPAAARDAMRLHIENSYREFLGTSPSYTLAVG